MKAIELEKAAGRQAARKLLPRQMSAQASQRHGELLRGRGTTGRSIPEGPVLERADHRRAQARANFGAPARLDMFRTLEAARRSADGRRQAQRFDRGDEARPAERSRRTPGSWRRRRRAHHARQIRRASRTPRKMRLATRPAFDRKPPTRSSQGNSTALANIARCRS